MDGYGNDTTATNSDTTAAAIAQIFSTGITAYVDSQAIQSGYQINDPRYFQSGYPAGVSSMYTPTSAGQGVRTATVQNNLVLWLVIGAAVFVLLKK